MRLKAKFWLSLSKKLAAVKFLFYFVFPARPIDTCQRDISSRINFQPKYIPCLPFCWGLYQNTFYSCSHFFIVVVQSVCQFYSSLIFAAKARCLLLQQSYVRRSTQVGCGHDCKYQTLWSDCVWLSQSYYNTRLITTILSFMKQASGLFLRK